MQESYDSLSQKARRKTSMSIDSVTAAGLSGRPAELFDVFRVGIRIFSEEEIDQNFKHRDEQNRRPKNSNDQSSVPSFHPHPSDNEQRDNLEHANENELRSCHTLFVWPRAFSEKL